MDHTCHGRCDPSAHCVNHIERQRAEHKHKLQRFGHTGQEHGQHGRHKHGTVILTLIRINTAVHSHSDTKKQACSSDHLAYLEPGRCYRSKKIRVGFHIARIFKVDQVCCPGQPQRILAKYLASSVHTGRNGVGAAKGSVVHRNGQHMMQAERAAADAPGFRR